MDKQTSHVISYTCGVPVSAASFMRTLRVSIVSDLYFLSLNRAFIGTATDLCTGLGDCLVERIFEGR